MHRLLSDCGLTLNAPYVFFLFSFFILYRLPSFFFFSKTGCQESVRSFCFPEVFCQPPFLFEHQSFFFFGHFADNVSSANRIISRHFVFADPEALWNIKQQMCQWRYIFINIQPCDGLEKMLIKNKKTLRRKQLFKSFKSNFDLNCFINLIWMYLK